MPLFLADLVSLGSNGNSIIIAARLHAAAIDEIVYVNWAEPIDVLIGTNLARLFSNRPVNEFGNRFEWFCVIYVIYIHEHSKLTSRLLFEYELNCLLYERRFLGYLYLIS